MTLAEACMLSGAHGAPVSWAVGRSAGETGSTACTSLTENTEWAAKKTNLVGSWRVGALSTPLRDTFRYQSHFVLTPARRSSCRTASRRYMP